MSEVTPNRYPKIVIQYCSKCKWQNRAIWYLQELLQTFGDSISDISLQPIADVPGTFQVILYKDDSTTPTIIYKRKFKKSTSSQEEDYYYDGFPDSKFLKILVRNQLNPGENLGHIDKYTQVELLNDGSDQIQKNKVTDQQECKVCKTEE